MNKHIKITVLSLLFASTASVAMAQRSASKVDQPQAPRVYEFLDINAYRSASHTLPPSPTMADKVLFDRTNDTSAN